MAQPYARVLRTRPPLLLSHLPYAANFFYKEFVSIDYDLETNSPHVEHSGMELVPCGVAGKSHWTGQAPEKITMPEAAR